MKKAKVLALLLVLAMVLSVALTGCAKKDEGNSGSDNEAETSEEAEEGEEEAEATTGGDTPMVVGYSHFSSKFSPFFAESAYDQDVQQMTQMQLLSSDRTGAVIYKGIEGETIPYDGTDYTYYGPADLVVTENEDGTVFYDFTLRDDLVFSDGEPVTVDDIIFSMYVLADPTYDGSSTLYAQPIQGMAEYRSGMSSLMNLLIEAGEDNTDFSNWDEATQTAFWAEYKDAFVGAIRNYCVGNGYNAEEDTIDAVMANWGFEVPAEATNAEVFDIMAEAYPSVPEMIAAESAGGEGDLMENYGTYTVGVETGESAPNIAGIQKTGDNTLRVVASELDATMIYQLTLNITPLHYYGDKAAFDYDNNQFGFTKGDLSTVRSKTTEPLGAGPYKFVKYENGVVNFEANENYFKGAPKTKYLQFREMTDTDKLNGVVTGTVDVTDPSFSKDTALAISGENGGELNGEVITTSLVDNLGYGYIGINSHNVSVGGEPGSDASKNLRKALATIFCVYRDVAIDSYYGDAAEVINYPISNTSWAAPQPADEGYQVAFSVDVDGNPIYTSDMSSDDKEAAAKEAALGFLEAAGYTITDGKATAAPEGASLSYEAMIPGDGAGDHPSFMILTLAKEALAEIGIELVINDLSNSSDLWDAIDAKTHEIWCAAWGATVDPDMYQIYYSDIANGGANAGGSNGHYQIEDPELDTMIMDARKSTDQAYRKQVYKACLDTIIDWACEVPVYQRQNCVIFSTERVKIDTVTPDITTFYPWASEVENTEMNQ